MQHRLALIGVVVLCAVGAALSSVGVSFARTSGAAHAAAWCTYGRIGGVTKCLHRGEYCSRAERRQYLRYGFTCSLRDDRGDWHLEYRWRHASRSPASARGLGSGGACYGSAHG